MTKYQRFSFKGWVVIVMMLASTFGHSASTSALRNQIGQMIMVGFTGTEPDEPAAQEVLKCAEQGLIGGVIFFAHNIKSPQQLKRLMDAFRKVQTPYPLLIALDQEGGKVQRLSSKNGFQDTASPHDVASQQTTEQAFRTYQTMAQQVAEAGFNLILGPVVDLEHLEPTKSPAIGKLGRSFGQDPKTVVTYASAFMDACHSKDVLTAIKHFPGHGLAEDDTHDDFVDVTKTFQSRELVPFYDLIQAEKVDMVMTAHVQMRNLDATYPSTLSKAILQKLLRDKGYTGVIISDCLNMGAIQKNFDLETIVVKAIDAGVDILLFSNHPILVDSKKQGGKAQYQAVSPMEQVTKLLQIIETACSEGALSAEQIQQSSDRVVALKEKM